METADHACPPASDRHARDVGEGDWIATAMGLFSVGLGAVSGSGAGTHGAVHRTQGRASESINDAMDRCSGTGLRHRHFRPPQARRFHVGAHRRRCDGPGPPGCGIRLSRDRKRQGPGGDRGGGRGHGARFHREFEAHPGAERRGKHLVGSKSSCAAVHHHSPFTRGDLPFLARFSKSAAFHEPH